MAKNFNELSEREILALAISLEEEDGRIYADFADGLRDNYPATAEIFRTMQAEEDSHRRSLIELYRQRFGEHIPLLRRHDVKGFVERKPVWLVRPLGIQTARKQVEIMELETRRFYERAIERTSDASTRKLLGDLAEAERQHSALADALEEQQLTPERRDQEEESQRRLFLLQIVQPGLAGLMDGSVSTLAPVFAAAFATQNTWDAFLVGMAASVGAGISMGFAEALSDDGSLTGRGRPIVRGGVCGLMTTAGGIGHTLPFLISDFHVALSAAIAVVAVELAAISFIRHRYMETPWFPTAVQEVIGGVLVFLAGVFSGKSSTAAMQHSGECVVMQRLQRMTAIIEREDDGFVALCPELDIASEGDSIEQARANLVEALTLFFEEASEAEITRRLHNEVFVTQVEVPVG
jgi:rubrerythrin/predicted RNase H-like HicB family nuclease